jgi:hypothetical protein
MNLAVLVIVTRAPDAAQRVAPLRSGALQSRGRNEHRFGTVPALRSGMKNAAPRPGHEGSPKPASPRR